MEYRQEHVRFVSNLKGTSIGDVIVCILHAPLCILLLKILQNNSSSSSFMREAVVLCFPIVLSLTLLSNVNTLSLLTLAAIGALGCVQALGRGLDRPVQGLLGPRKPFLSNFKGANMLLTCIAILAVDFPAFPRRYAKTETFGTGLMDVGVGAFLVSSAVTSRYARGFAASCNKPDSPDEKKSDPQTYNLTVRHARRAFLQILPVLLLGIGRMIVVKLIGYQEHVSEYGSHWNFFVSLACVWFLSDLIHTCIPSSFVAPVCVCVIALYQGLLSYTPLTDWIIGASRQHSNPIIHFVRANREGLTSVIGYTALYLLAEDSARRVYWQQTNMRKSSKRDLLSAGTSPSAPAANPSVNNIPSDGVTPTHAHTHTPTNASDRSSRDTVRAMLVRTMYLDVAWFVIWGLSTIVQRTSRRLVNAPFIFLSLSLSFGVIGILLGIDWLLGSNRIELLERINSHQLLVFLAANIITGVVNMSIRTIHTRDVVSVPLLLCYGMCVCAFAWHSPTLVAAMNPLLAKLTKS